MWNIWLFPLSETHGRPVGFTRGKALARSKPSPKGTVGLPRGDPRALPRRDTVASVCVAVSQERARPVDNLEANGCHVVCKPPDPKKLQRRCILLLTACFTYVFFMQKNSDGRLLVAFGCHVASFKLPPGCVRQVMPVGKQKGNHRPIDSG